MANTRPSTLTPPADTNRDHVLGPPDAEMTLVEYGSYACRNCHAVHEVVEGLRSRFGDRMRYVFRHLPVSGNEDAVRAAELAEYASQTTGRFWDVHEALMERGPAFSQDDFGRIVKEFNLPPDDIGHEPERTAARARVREDVESARQSGARVTPTFFINGRRYAGTWDESSLADAMLGSLGHRIQAAAFDFVRWGPSAGLLLGLATLLALVLSNSPAGTAFLSWWDTRFGFQWGESDFVLTLLDSLGDVASYEGRLDEAIAYYDREHALASELGDATSLAVSLAGTAVAKAYQGRHDEAVRSLEGATSTSITGEGWLWYARGEALLERDPEIALASLDRAVECLGGLLLDDVGQGASGARERHVDDERVVLVVPAEVVDEAEVDDVDPELGVHDVFQRLGDLVEALGRE